MAPRSAGPDVAPLVVIVGETASGKTALAIELAKHFNGEIICADSRTVYKGMDIGTAKPTLAERAGIQHYGLDVVDLGQPFNAYNFQQLAFQAISNITRRGKLPIMVGGTGLYIDGVLYNFAFRQPPLRQERDALQKLSVPELQRRVLAAGYVLPENVTNRRHLTRLLEAGPAPRQVKRLRPNTVVLGLRVPREELTARITARIDAMVDGGLVAEVRALLERNASTEALKAPGYKAMAAYIRGEADLEEAKRQFAQADRNLAKRQRTWFGHNADIHWLDNRDKLAEAVELVTTLLAG